jgi:hypothetical protein
MTFVQLQVLVSSWLDDTSNGYFTLSEVKTWLNNAQREAQKMVIQAFEGHYRKVVQTTMVQYQREYQLPSDFKKLSRLEVVLSGTTFQTENCQRIAKITENQQDMMPERTGSPQAYYFKGDQIVLVPAPDSAKTLRLTYLYRVADMVNDADTPDIPADYHEYLAVLATLDGLYKDGRDPGPMLNKKEYFEKLFKQDAEERNVDESRTIVQTQDDDYGD